MSEKSEMIEQCREALDLAKQADAALDLLAYEIDDIWADYESDGEIPAWVNEMKTMLDDLTLYAGQGLFNDRSEYMISAAFKMLEFISHQGN